jgi:hypothetical protein
MGTIPDDMSGIFENLREAALTMQQGGGIGHDFSTLRPKGALVASIGADASGPVSFMDVWDAMCRTIMSAGARRGAMMATLRCDHPDIEAFIDAKADAARLRNFNLSVLVTDAFIRAVRNDEAWDLSFAGKVYRTLPARMSRGIGGHSMGGYGALRIGMKRPDVFLSLYLMSSCCLAANASPRPDSMMARSTLRPMRPNPLIATRTAMLFLL